jgi:hypothetical protein
MPEAITISEPMSTARTGHSPKTNQPSAVAQIIVEYSKGAISEASP